MQLGLGSEKRVLIWSSEPSTERFKVSHVRCATGNPVPVPVDPVPVDPVIFQIWFRSGSGQILTGSTGFC